ncbi:MAG: Mut7-C RNAse domain-containing protein, partial [Anaerolineae bacterium]
VYPVFESVDITPVLRLRPEPLREPRFVLDTHLGRLAAYLRLSGFDTLYWSDIEDAELADLSRREPRILLTKDRDLLKRRSVTHGYFVREVHPRAQLAEVVRRFDLARSMHPFHRCLRCNGILQQVPKEAVLDQLPARTQQGFEEFQRCPDCGRIYWKGSHYRRMQRLIAAVLQELAE